MEVHNDVELNDLSDHRRSSVQDEIDDTSQSVEQAAQHEFSLPRADGGKDAWLFLAAGFVVEALVWGQSWVPLASF